MGYNTYMRFKVECMRKTMVYSTMQSHNSKKSMVGRKATFVPFGNTASTTTRTQATDDYHIDHHVRTHHNTTIGQMTIQKSTKVPRIKPTGFFG